MNWFILCAIVIVLLISCKYYKMVEKYESSWNLLDSKINENCYNINDLSKCSNNNNCGLLIKNSVAKCIPGDIDGPFFENSQDSKWMYNGIIGSTYDTLMPFYTTMPLNNYSPLF